jgi:hypothetical protein
VAVVSVTDPGPDGHHGVRATPRRSVLRAAVLGAAGIASGAGVSGCAPSPSSSEPAEEASTTSTGSVTSSGGVLLAYFSRAGENYHYGGRRRLQVGNTPVVADMIGRLIRCDVHGIEAADPYPDDYEATVRRNVREQDADARPGIANPLTSIERCDTVILGSPIWNHHPCHERPRNDRDYTASCPGASLGEGLAVQGEEVRNAGPAVDSWLRRTGLLG